MTQYIIYYISGIDYTYFTLMRGNIKKYLYTTTTNDIETNWFLNLEPPVSEEPYRSKTKINIKTKNDNDNKNSNIEMNQTNKNNDNLKNLNNNKDKKI